MLIYIKIFQESFSQAWQQLRANKLRSFLSLLGITIGIFCIISVMSAVDSLENNIRGSFEKLGNDVLYIDKRPWNEDPGQNYWKYAARPNPDFQDLQVIQQRSTLAQNSALSIFIPGRTIKYGSSNVRGAYMAGVTFDYDKIIQLDIEYGRYFTPFEYQNALNRVILGYQLSTELFGTIDPIGKEIKIGGHKFQVIGVLKKEGESLVNVIPFDDAIFISYNTAKKLVNVKTGATWGSMLQVKAKDSEQVTELRDEVTGILRAHRRIRPMEDSNFAINELGILGALLDSFFSVLNLAGVAIGIFAIFVGIFSVANIMFVSVKERTNIIGVKKALGAKKSFILMEFLNEAVVLCLVGGLMGLALVFVAVKAISAGIDFDIFLSTGNILLGIGLSVIIGILSGVIPALQAAGMDPVEAIRAK
jgi:putative ABC transport system permease protein